MKNSKQIFITLIIFLLVLCQIVFLYQKSQANLSFYPNWTVYPKKDVISIYSPYGLTVQLVPDMYQGYFKFNKNLNSLIINQSGIGMNLKYCNNCYLIDSKKHVVFTLTDPSEDIVLKKKLVENGFSVKKAEEFEYKKDINLAIFNAVSEEMIAINTKTNSIIHIDSINNSVEIISNQLKIEFL